ncbi:MAG: hypothetical protein A4E19_03025 [Nitrospira sp. SG-bin1]|nr:MAG: hypothetical protein A4E19_03025 [Nitrospira sp. SG-bin1]
MVLLECCGKVTMDGFFSFHDMKGQAMWFLLIVLLAPPSGIDRATVLNAFETYEACKPERDRVGFEMAESYPYENDFRIVCEFREKTSPQLPIRYQRES